MTKIHYSLTEAAKLKNVRREAVYYAIRSGALEAEKVGNTYMIIAAALEKYTPRLYQDKRTHQKEDT